MNTRWFIIFALFLTAHLRVAPAEAFQPRGSASVESPFPEPETDSTGPRATPPTTRLPTLGITDPKALPSMKVLERGAEAIAPNLPARPEPWLAEYLAVPALSESEAKRAEPKPSLTGKGLPSHAQPPRGLQPLSGKTP